MSHHGNPPQAEQDRTPGRIGIETAAQAGQRVAKQEPARGRHGPRAGRGAYRFGNGLGRSLDRLQDDVAGEPIGDDHLGHPGQQVPPLDVSR